MLVVATGVLRRRSTASMLGYTFALAAIFALYSVLPIIDLMDMAAHTTSHYELDNAPGNLLILAGFLLVAIAVGGVLLTRSRTVHLWLPTGESFYRVRQRILGLPIGRRRKIHMFRPNLSYQWESYGRRVIKLLAGRKRMTFDVRCDLTDLPVAEVIKKACLSAGLFEDKRGGQWVFVLVSSMTDWEKARTDHKKLAGRAIFVLVDSVQLPPDANELRRHQWLDFREQLPEGLFNLLVALCTDKAEDHDSASLPINTHRFRAPQFVRGLVELSRTYIVSIAAFALGAVVLRPLEISTSTLLGISVLLIVCLARLMILTATRQLTKEQFGSLAGITCLLMLLWLIVVISIVPGEPAIMGLLWPIVLLVSLVGTLIRIYLHVSRYWLPKSIGLTSQRSVVAVDPPLFTSSMPLIASMSFGMAIIFFQ